MSGKYRLHACAFITAAILVATVAVTGWCVQSSAFAKSDTLVISEVFYDPAGSGDNKEWIELYNVSNNAINLADYKIGDEETQNGAEAMFQFPIGATIGPGEVILIAYSAQAISDTFAITATYELTNSLTSVPDLLPYAAWASGIFDLDDAGDEVLLLDADDQVVDALSWGNSTIIFNPAIPVVASGHSLERKPANQDTDTAGDWQDQASPAPGTVTLAHFVYLPVIIRADIAKVVFNDNFDAWSLQTEAGATGYLQDGKLILQQTATAYGGSQEIASTVLPSDFSVEVKGKRVTGTNAWYGIVFNWQNASNYEMLVIDPDGQRLAVYECRNGTRTRIVDWKPVSAIIPGNQENALKLERMAGSNDVTVTINGTLMAPLTLPTNAFTGGKAGLLLWAGAGLPAQAAFDDFKITILPTPWSDNFDAWSLQTEAGATGYMQDGKLVLQQAVTAYGFSQEIASTVLPSDFSVEVKGKRVTGTNAWYGIVFHWQNASNYEMLVIDPDGQRLAVYEYRNGVRTRIVDWKPAPAVLSGNQENLLKLERAAGSNNITVTINGTPLAPLTLPASAFTGGKAGLLLWAGAGLPAQAVFDDFKIWDLP
jgi:hypothetical protein